VFRRPPSIEFYLTKGMVNEAAPLVEKEYAASPSRLRNRVYRDRLYTLQRKFAAAATEIAAVEIEAENAPRALPFHHISYGTPRSAQVWVMLHAPSIGSRSRSIPDGPITP
jgi:hypothetical protein